MRRPHSAVVLFSLIGVAPLRGQTAADGAKGSPWQLGGTIMVPTADGGSQFTGVGLMASTTTRNAAGADLAFVVVPRALGHGALTVGLRANVGVPLTVGQHLVVMPSAGLTFIGSAASGGGAGSTGVNGTIAATYFAEPPASRGGSFGVRGALAFHRFNNFGDTFRMFELGIVRRFR